MNNGKKMPFRVCVLYRGGESYLLGIFYTTNIYVGRYGAEKQIYTCFIAGKLLFNDYYTGVNNLNSGGDA